MVALLFAATSSSALHAGTLLSVNFGGSGGAFGTVITDTAFGVAHWRLATAYSGVNISIDPLSLCCGIPDLGTAYLTTAIGPGTTAAQEIANTTFHFVGGLVFTGLSLGPGDYYLTIARTAQQAADSGPLEIMFGWGGWETISVSAAPGVTHFSDYYSNPGGAYPPGSDFGVLSGGFGYEITEAGSGTVPEPSSIFLLTGGILALSILCRHGAWLR